MQKSTGEVVGLDYWMQWQVPVCGLIIVAPAAVAIKLIRALAFLSMTWLLYQTLLFAGTFAFYFYTQWTFALVLVYFAVGTIMSARGCLISSDRLQIRTTEKDKLQKNGLEAKRKSNNNLQNHKSNGEAYQGAGFLASVMQILYQTSAGASVLTDLVFWCVLVPMHSGIDFELTLLIGCLHSVNVVILVIDSLLNALVSREPPLLCAHFRRQISLCGFFYLTAISMVRLQLFYPLDCHICCIPMDTPCMWLYMVAISISRTCNSMGTSVVSWNGFDPRSMLWSILAVREDEKLNLLYTVPRSIFEITRRDVAPQESSLR